MRCTQLLACVKAQSHLHQQDFEESTLTQHAQVLTPDSGLEAVGGLGWTRPVT